MNEKPSKHELTVLQWLGVAAVVGIVLTVILNYLR
jgi:predicted RND superfamily exporter protein